MRSGQRPALSPALGCGRPGPRHHRGAEGCAPPHNLSSPVPVSLPQAPPGPPSATGVPQALRATPQTGAAVGCSALRPQRNAAHRQDKMGAGVDLPRPHTPTPVPSQQRPPGTGSRRPPLPPADPPPPPGSPRPAWRRPARRAARVGAGVGLRCAGGSRGFSLPPFPATAAMKSKPSAHKSGNTHRVSARPASPRLVAGGREGSSVFCRRVSV